MLRCTAAIVSATGFQLQAPRRRPPRTLVAAAACLVWLAVAALAQAPGGREVFTDRAAESGVDFVHFNGMTGKFYTAEVTSGGCAVLDYDNDGDLDLFFVQGSVLEPGKTAAEALIPPRHPLPLTHRLYRNDSTLEPGGGVRLRFADVTARSGIASSGYGMGVATGDYDNDGWIDLYVTSLGEDRLYRNRGDGTFEDVTRRAGVGEPRWSVPAAFFDYDRDGWLDLYVGNYVKFEAGDHRTCLRVTGAVDYCGPLAYDPLPDRLFHNQRDGTFRDVTREAGLLAAFGSALGVVAADLTGDGWPDLLVANDGRPNQLWVNRRDGTFADEALIRGAALSAQGMAEAGMGIEAADLDGDGDEDLYITHLKGESAADFRNDGQGYFEDRRIPSGLGPASRWATGFGALAIDFDNDGWLDIFTVNGEVRVIEEQARQGDVLPLRQPRQLFRNLGAGRFQEVSAESGSAFREAEVGRSAAMGDLDDDGDSDVVVLNAAGPARVLVNQLGQLGQPGEAGARRWLGVRAVGAGGRDLLGARLAVVRPGRPTLWRRVRTDGSYAAASDPRVLFGLGDAAGGETLRAVWPDGGVSEWVGVPAGRYLSVRRREAP
jgi:hypothetical protein